MTEESSGPKAETVTKEKTSGSTPDKKAEKKTEKKAEKKAVETPTHEGQKPVTDSYRENWNRIFGGKG